MKVFVNNTINFLIYVLEPIGAMTKFTAWQSICHVHESRSIWFKVQPLFKILQFLTLPINRSTCIPVAAMSKLKATSF